MQLLEFDRKTVKGKSELDRTLQSGWNNNRETDSEQNVKLLHIGTEIRDNTILELDQKKFESEQALEEEHLI